ncbi:hypothetical protein R3P38DRAFT_3241858 [Favolaschia claudopus]|uniref:Uncharacterized protein n=1 Tax=Favolaschia claudopus TaxID=2862362 RepID=A0AAV9Z5G9_9AGAR
MLSLRFQQSNPSLLSYWSDNMSVGPNLPLHTLSKPAIRFLYQLQVKKFIKVNENHPLSDEMIAVFGSYLEHKYISSATKCMILDHLHSKLKLLEMEECFSTMEMLCRCSPSLVEALQSAFDSPLNHLVLFVPSAKLCDWVQQVPNVLEGLRYFSHCLFPPSWSLVGSALHERLHLVADDDLLLFMSTGLLPILNIHHLAPRKMLFKAIFVRTLAESSPPELQELTLDIFTSYIGSGPEFSMQLVILDVIARVDFNDRTKISIMKSLAVKQNFVPDLLQDPARTIYMCLALENLVRTQAASVIRIMLDLDLHLFLVQLLSRSDTPSVFAQCAALRVLRWICIWPEGAEAVVLETNMLQIAKKPLGSEEMSVAMGHCLQAIAQHKLTYVTYPSILSAGLIIDKPLVLLLSDGKDQDKVSGS